MENWIVRWRAYRGGSKPTRLYPVKLAKQAEAWYPTGDQAKGPYDLDGWGFALLMNKTEEKGGRVKW